MDYMTATDEMIRTIGGMQKELDAGACFGSPVERDGHTLIPVARVNFGYGLGFGGGTGSKMTPSGNGSTSDEGGSGGGGGGGGGGSATPVAVIDITRDEVVIREVRDNTRIALTFIMFMAWCAFWLTFTLRSLARTSAKTRRYEIQHAAK